MDQALATLSARKDAWAWMDIPSRIALLDQIKQDLPKVEKRWVAQSLAAKEGIHETMAEGEEWHNITVVYRYIRMLSKALQDILKFGKPKIPGKISTRPNGQVVAQVIPYDWKDGLALPGYRGEVWMDPSVTLEDGIPQASFYQSQEKKGRVCVLLGAGNASGTVPTDFLHKLFVEGQVVALKMNPVNEYLGQILDDGFSTLVKAGYLQILYGGSQEGSYLCNHPAVESVHLTGSARTYEEIVFGLGEEGRKRKQARKPQFTKPFTAELGNISPVIVVPSPWSAKEIKKQSAKIGSWIVPNSAHNCLTPRMIIQKKDWEHREKLNHEIARFLEGIHTRKAYYPGSFRLYQQFMEAHPEALQLGDLQEGHLPWTFIQDLDPTNSEDMCFSCEPFMSLYSETALEADDVAEFISKAVVFANEKLWGTLVASIVVHPKSLNDPTVAADVEQAIADLRYGSIVINQWGAYAHYMMATPWGGYPGSDMFDVQSGIGFVNNPLMFDSIQKSVVYTAFTPLVDPSLVNLSNNYLYFRQDTRYQYHPSIGNLVSLIWKAIMCKEAKTHA